MTSRIADSVIEGKQIAGEGELEETATESGESETPSAAAETPEVTASEQQSESGTREDEPSVAVE